MSSLFTKLLRSRCSLNFGSLSDITRNGIILKSVLCTRIYVIFWIININTVK